MAALGAARKCRRKPANINIGSISWRGMGIGDVASTRRINLRISTRKHRK